MRRDCTIYSRRIGAMRGPRDSQMLVWTPVFHAGTPTASTNGRFESRPIFAMFVLLTVVTMTTNVHRCCAPSCLTPRNRHSSMGGGGGERTKKTEHKETNNNKTNRRIAGTNRINREETRGNYQSSHPVKRTGARAWLRCEASPSQRPWNCSASLNVRTWRESRTAGASAFARKSSVTAL